MKVGILSDTHDNLPQIEKAIALFNRQQVDLVLHAGDFVAPFAIAKFQELSCPWAGVFGNNDGEKKGLAAASEGRIQEGPLRTTLGGRKITVVHDIASINPQTEEADLIVFGHTHRQAALKQQDKLLINPGECGGWLSGKSTVAVVDLETMSGKHTTL
ncbi:MAG TPA: metallophosphoesterase [Patescibacteria group bacterium]|nr:metallophosphoesterase [Patescibacteria group bacterium]